MSSSSLHSRIPISIIFPPVEEVGNISQHRLLGAFNYHIQEINLVKINKWKNYEFYKKCLYVPNFRIKRIVFLGNKKNYSN